MVNASALLSAVLVIIVIWLIVNKLVSQKWKNRPPGPTGIPIFGNFFQLGKGGGPLEVVQKWKDEYGDVVALHFGQYRAVILNGHETIKEAYNMMEFAGRPLLKPFEIIAGGGKHGLLVSEGKPWSEQRRFALRNLRDFGFGKKSMEAFTHEDITELIDYLKENEGQPFVPHRKFALSVVKSLWNIIAGEKFAYGDKKFQHVLDCISSVVTSTSLTGPVFFLPWLTTLFPEMSGYKMFQTSVGKAKALIRGYIEDHQKTFQRDNIRDFMDVYLKEISDTRDRDSSFYKDTGHRHFLVVVLNLFAAGSETTSNTLVWALMYLTKNPDVQEKLYEEVRDVIGTSRLPSLEDRDGCVYTWAVMEEVFRLSSLAPLGIFHSTMQDVTFRGYFIPKDTLVLTNLYGVHHDKKIWGDPQVFRPERFLKESGDGKLSKNGDVGPCIPFSVGKRACLGEILARNNFFLYLTSLVQKFQFVANGDFETGGSSGLLRSPNKFEVILKLRE